MSATAPTEWTVTDMGDLTGRVAVITGASAGIGCATAAALAGNGATVVLACRDVVKGQAAVARIAQEGVDRESLSVVALDLTSPASVQAASTQILSSTSRVDLLVNNAGVMAIPFALSADGVEVTFATNHLGHFALTGRLLPRMLATPSSRVITISSNAHRRARPRWDLEAMWGEYDSGAAYDHSKLANLLFAFELHRRLRAAGSSTVSVAAHPGNARTGLWRTSSWPERALVGSRLRRLTGMLVQSPQDGALPTLRAATDPRVGGGEYFGPGGRFGFTGAPVLVQASDAAHDATAQRRLWERSEQLSGVTYEL